MFMCSLGVVVLAPLLVVGLWDFHVVVFRNFVGFVVVRHVFGGFSDDRARDLTFWEFPVRHCRFFDGHVVIFYFV